MIDASDKRVVWTDERVARLREVWGRGRSARQIAMELGVSRNAVISKAHRIGLETCLFVKGGPKPRHTAQPKKRTSGLPKRNGRHPKLPPPIAGPSITEPIRFMDLKPHHCRWPLGDEPIMFCGVTKHETSSYCTYHTRMSYRSAESKVA